MLFNSLAYLIFFPIVFCCYWILGFKSVRLQNILLLAASYFFYGWWNYKLVGLLMTSTLIDYFFGALIIKDRANRAKLFLTLSIIINLLILGFFKYYNFFAIELNDLLQQLGFSFSFELLEIILPIGISFYTFHGISYVIDCYRKQQTHVPNIIDYAVFVSFFPLLVAGPIERAQHLLPQVVRSRIFNYSLWVQGSRLMLWGFFKKVVIADSLAQIANPIYADYGNMSPAMLAIGTLAFSFQIYTDFSAYSDIALGSAKLLGFELLSNFKFPYFSRSIAEFWRRWHISLSSWFRDYLYIPLGGSREGVVRAIFNTIIIFLVSGFWHGASWNFLIWGGLHALYFIPLMWKGRKEKYKTLVVAQEKMLPSKTELFQMTTTFILVALAWNFFRIQTFKDAITYSKKMLTGLFEFNLNLSHVEIITDAIWWIPFLIVIDWINRRDERNFIVPKNIFLRWGLYVLMTGCIFMSANKDQTFLYFQF